MKIAILGRKKDTVNYENYVKKISATPITTLSPGELSNCDGLILPGGADIAPAFYGEYNTGCHNIDTELDILQFQALDFCIHHSIPVLGICKGMQVINVAFGGTLIQDIPNSESHRYDNGDKQHNTRILESSCLYPLYGGQTLVNSAHHQCVGQLGNNLNAIQWCTLDNCIEAIFHESLPILGVQWHPERLNLPEVSGLPILNLFASWCDVYHHACDEKNSL